MRFDISEVARDFQNFSVAVLVCGDVEIPTRRSSPLAEFIALCEREARAAWDAMELSEIPGVAAWRRAYRQFGIKKTSYRSSVERLVKNVIAGAELPAINGFVDAYNAVSLAYVLPAGADDLDRIQSPLAFRYARPGDSFLDMGALDEAGEPLSDPPKGGEVVYADAEHVLCRRWNWRQDARSMIRLDTRRAVVTLQANGVGDVRKAADELVGLLRRECGGRHAVTVLDAGSPIREFVAPPLS
jgi:DNA/RNA-binding domain of Phe-tRNA-synthetase-like protein